MRNRFEEQLFELNREIIEMGALCEEAISKTVEALTTGNTALAADVVSGSGAIDQMERSIESLCMKLLLHQQPVARDLRLISAAMKMAEIITFLGGRTMENGSLIPKMAREATGMVTSSVDAFVKKDVALARQVIARDDVVDDCFNQIKGRIIDFIAKNPADGEFSLDLLMISKYFERIADHATNIAEWVIYAVTGTHQEDEK